jgi:hypothetical protein
LVEDFEKGVVVDEGCFGSTVDEGLESYICQLCVDDGEVDALVHFLTGDELVDEPGNVVDVLGVRDRFDFCDSFEPLLGGMVVSFYALPPWFEGPFGFPSRSKLGQSLAL